ncbi:methyl-coenzyme M reductase glutamine C-methyltransferase [Methanobacterium alcaliphilum]|uniref:methyl-coenzyme M reductase glutamine C-methyltransferase n=1 Tax=Methanobacterium alcaliphilum TaxID=392018 RepID=UPI00200ACA21|nr:methyl-coenzyme M reductase glutamine C-methyltransferase [Methanobacterium alcaliphilum]MCK9151532.1 TIGR04014 family B12-binding domain/radical SAM domain-containing protein [Methanobacterium alcaliphilum]
MNKKAFKITVLTPEFYNYGSMVIAGILKDLGYDVNLQKGFESPLNADIVFLSLHSTIHLIKYQAKINQINAFKIVGGPVSNDPKLVFKCLNVDLVFIGEAERNLQTLMKLIEKNGLNNFFDSKNTHNTPFLAFRNTDLTENFFIKNKDKSPTTLIRPLPLIPKNIKHENIRGANVYIETHRGCPGNCGFCQVPYFFGRDVISRPLDDIITEVNAFLQQGAKRIAISGGTGSLYGSKKFKNIDENSFITLLKELSKLTGPKNLTVPDIRIDMISPDILDAINQYTNGWVYYGIESGSEKILNKMKKSISLEDVRSAVDDAHNHGVKVAGSFIVGYPGEEEDDYEATLDLADELILDDYFISIAEPIPGTPLGNEIQDIPFEQNPVFMKNNNAIKPLQTTAEFRALNFMMESFIFRTIPVAMSDDLFKSLLKEVQSQSQHIQAVTYLLKNRKCD